MSAGTLSKVEITFSLMSDVVSALSNIAAPCLDRVLTTCYNYGGVQLIYFL